LEQFSAFAISLEPPMKKQFALNVGVALSLALANAAAFAQPVTPTFTTFGALPAATFAGTGIPNTNVAITSYSGLASLSAVTLGLSAAQRCSGLICGSALTNDGAGTFTAQSGAPFAANPTYASWNVNFYASGNTTLYNFKLLYDFNPAVANAATTHGEIKLFTLSGSSGTGGLDQNSLNMGFGYLTTGVPFVPGVVTPPSFTPFNPNVNGEYSFALIASDKASGLELARSAIVINAVPEPEGYVLGLAGLLGLAVAARRRRSTR
jgi:MYXO-CTERM domain-containing protein